MSRNRRNGYEDEGMSYFRGSNSRGRAQNFRDASYDDYEDEDFSGVYDDSSSYGDYEGDYEDDDYEDYGELGSNYDPESDPNWGYDNFDTYNTDLEKNRRARQALYKNDRANDYVNDVGILSPVERSDMLNADKARADRQASRSSANSSDLSKYLDSLERYDRGEINNYEMSKIQRKYANNPFWETFRPSKDMIKKYGSGNRSTRWPMFRNEGGRWVPEIWRND